MFEKHLSMGVAAVAAMLAVSCGKGAATGNDIVVDSFPGEVTEPPISIRASYYTRASDGHTIALIPSPVTRKFVAADLTSNTSNDTAINLPVSGMPILTFHLDGNRWLTTDIVPDSCKIRRTIFGADGNPIANSALDEFNTAVASDISQISEVIRFPVIKPDGERVADQRGYCGIIDVWNTKTGERFRITYPDVNNSDSSIQSRVRENKQLFQGGAAYDDFFVMQRINDDCSSNIDFFAWDGAPLGTLHIEGTGLRRVDFDLTNGDMYCLDAEIDQIVKYPVGDFLSQLKR